MTFRWSAVDFIDSCQTSADIGQTLEEFLALVADIGLTDFAIVNLWEVDDRVTTGIRISTVDPHWLDHYAASGFDRCDAVWQSARISGCPHRWSRAWERLGLSPEAQRIREEYATVGLRDGLTIPVFNEWSQKSMVMLGGEHMLDIAGSDEVLLASAATTLRHKLAKIDAPKPAASPRLTPREREVLSWTADGKSAWEIAEILKVSEATIARHLLNVRAKLRVANTTHAVATAIRSHEIMT